MSNTNIHERLLELEKENYLLRSELKSIEEIYNNTTIGLYRTNPEGEILMANLPLVKMLGFSSFEELQSYNLNTDELISKKERKKFQSKILKNNIIIGKEAIWFKKNGEKIHIRESAKGIKNESGKVLYYEGTVENISEQKLKEQELVESELKYKSLLEILPSGVVMHQNEIVLYANEYANHLIRSGSNVSILGKNIYEFIHPDYHQYAKNRIAKSAAEFKHAMLTEEVFLTLAGTPVNVEVITVPYKQDDEVYLLTVFTDITDRKKTEKTLKLSEVTYRGMINSISEAIFIQDVNGVFIDVNKTAEDLFGYPVNYLQDKTPADIGAKNKNDIIKLLDQTRSAFNGKREIFEFYGLKSDGNIIPTEVTLVPGTYFDKRVVIAVLRDITERKKAEKIILESEKKYKSLIDFAVGGILIGNHEGIIIEANSYMCELLGRPRNKIVGDHISEGIFIKDSLNDTPLDFESLKEGETIISERKILRSDGREIAIEMHTKMMPDGSYQSIFHDISERKNAERDILKAKAKAENLNLHKEALLSALPDMLFTFDQNGLIIDFYSNSLKNLIKKPKMFFNKNISETVSLDIADLTKKNITKVLKSKYMTNFQYQTRIKGDIKYYDVKMVYFKENTVLALIRDITERMALIENLKESQQKAEESDKLKSAFLSNLSHEIRTPMNGILGFADLLKDDITEDEKMAYIKIIESSANQLLLILDDILEISKIEAGIVSKKTESFDILEFIKNIHSQMSVAFSESAEVKFIISPNIPSQSVTCISDPIKLKQILVNFISNANKFTKKGYVEIGYEQLSDSFLRFWVKDTGIGISHDNIENIFKRFVQIENQLSNFVRGSGLGLPICKAYAKMLDGEIEVKSTLGKGSSFYLTIPIISFSPYYNLQ
ncbi:MAG: PAS domain S-box protein [Bacteroidales bacterium]|nr:PAS domain S-box protein [Bacteroidales bacterium]